MNPQQLRKLSELLLSLKSKVKCPVCLDYVENSVELECSHKFCNTCLSELRLQTSICPLCKVQIGKRSPIYKDQFADDLSKFCNRTSQLIKEKYAHEVEELCSKKRNLQDIIDTSPQVVHTVTAVSHIPDTEHKELTDNTFDRILPNPRRSYTNKKKQAKELKVINFKDADARNKIINWLNDNQAKLDTLTYSPQVLSDNEGDFQMPSISQVPSKRKQKQTSKKRSQSLSMDDNLPEPLVKRYRSLTEGLNENDDYNIEEDHSETFVKQVERKVLQDLLEDECLANLEQAAQQSKEKPNATTSKTRGKSEKNKTADISISDSSSGWDRIKDVNKSIKKASKEPKKLHINLQNVNQNVKKPPKRTSKQSPIEKRRSKRTTPAKTGKLVENKEQEHEKLKECSPTKDVNVKTFNLSAIETYFEKHMEVTLPNDKDTSSNMEIDIIEATITNTKDTHQNNKANLRDNEKRHEAEVFCQATQLTTHSASQNAICHISPIPVEFNDIQSIAIRLTDNLKSCVSSAANLHNAMSDQLVQCFTNLLTYADKILKSETKKTAVGIQTSQITNVSTKSTGTQTKTVKSLSVSAQTKIKKLFNKYIQTSQDYQSFGAQTDGPCCVDKGIQTAEQVSTTTVTRERSVERIMMQSVNCRLSPDDIVTKSSSTNSSTKNSKRRKSSRESASSKISDEKEIISTKTSQNSKGIKELHISTDGSRENNSGKVSAKTSQNSKGSKDYIKELHISDDDSKENKSGKTLNIISQGSVLICSPDPSNKCEIKINRKLHFGETQNRKFKRIKRPASDDSDEDGNPSKRKFIRDNLSVEFIDTEKPVRSTNFESEEMDYDQYLLEVMERYDPPPPNKPVIAVETNNPPKSKGSQSVGSNKLSSIEAKNDKYQSKPPKSKMAPSVQKSQRKTQQDTDSGEHIFTANIAFEEHLDRFDEEILAFERNSKTYNTELDLVENTPMVSPRPKIPKLSHKRKDNIVQPLQIISKGSASDNNSKSNKPDPSCLSDLIDKEPGTLNRNIDIPPQSEKCLDGVESMLEGLHEDEDFFKSQSECDDKEAVIDIPRRQSSKIDLVDNGRTTITLGSGGKVNVTRENIDEVLENVNDFNDDDEDIEEELRKISFTAAQKQSKDDGRINILQDVKLKSPSKSNLENELDAVIESSDISDEEIVETTPQKKNTSFNRSLLENLKELEKPFADDALEFCLPPPPGFGDDAETNLPLQDLGEDPSKENFPPLVENKSSVTPDRLSDFIVTPDERALHTEKEESQRSLTFKDSFATPNRPAKEKVQTPRISQLILDETEGVFSPIAKCSVKLTQAKYTPLVSTSRSSAKKPSLMTSTPNQKSILNYVLPSQESPAMLSQKSRPCIMWSRILNKDLNIFTQLECKKLVTTSKIFSPQVTHLIVLVDEQGRIVSHTAKILQAIAAGIWVVRYEWTQDCLKMNRIVPEEPYEALDTSGVPGPQISRLLKGSKPLFKGFKFYCASPVKTVSKADLESILRLAGAEIAKDLGALLNNDGKIQIILTESSATEDTDQFDTWLDIYKAVTVDVEWLSCCIGQYKLVSFRPFLISGDESVICDLGYPPTLVESVPYTLTEAL